MYLVMSVDLPRDLSIIPAAWRCAPNKLSGLGAALTFRSWGTTNTGGDNHPARICISFNNILAVVSIIIHYTVQSTAPPALLRSRWSLECVDAVTAAVAQRTLARSRSARAGGAQQLNNANAQLKVIFIAYTLPHSLPLGKAFTNVIWSAPRSAAQSEKRHPLPLHSADPRNPPSPDFPYARY